MKRFLILLFFTANTCIAQEWQAELGVGFSGYNGDLTDRNLSFRTIGPAANASIKYSIDNLVIIRGSLSWGRIKGNDGYNKSELQTRNLSFQTNILEGTICGEVNLLEPEIFNVYPYLFAGVGFFHFNPYTYDDSKVKRFLRPLSTEGQGLPQYPEKKKYSLTQFCLPIGAGFKVRINDKYDFAYEFGYRILSTDYLDDVSTTYVDLEILAAEKGRTAAELSSRHKLGFQGVGAVRGNPDIKDWYFFNNFKLIFNLSAINKARKKKKAEEEEKKNTSTEEHN